MKLISAISFLLATFLVAEPFGKGWYNESPEKIDLSSILPNQEPSPLSFQPLALNAGVQSVQANFTNGDFSELDAFAKGLKNDPLFIFEHVVNHYEFSLYSGIVKGALQTYYDREGNDWDLAVYTAKLLELAQVENSKITNVEVVHGYMVMPDVQIATWIGCENDRSVIGTNLINAGIAFDDSSQGSMIVERAWVEVGYDGSTYQLDVGFKQHSIRQSIDLATATQLDFSSLSTQAGGTESADWVSGLNTTSLVNYLNSSASNLSSYLQGNHANDTSFTVLGGKKIIEQQVNSLPATPFFSYTVIGKYGLNSLPSDKTATLQIQHGGIDVTYPIHEIAGRKISVRYQGQEAAQALAFQPLALSAPEDEALTPVIEQPEVVEAPITGELEADQGPLIVESSQTLTDTTDELESPLNTQTFAIAALSSNLLVDFGIHQKGTADRLGGYSYGNPAGSPSVRVRVEADITSGGNAFRVQNSRYYVNYGTDLQLLTYFKNSTIARGTYNGTARFKLFWNENTQPFQTITHDLTGRVSEIPSITYGGGGVVAEVGTTQSFTVYFKNTGTQSMGVSGVTKSGSGAARFSFVSGHGNSTLSPGGTKTFTLNYSPLSRTTNNANVNFTIAYDGLNYNYSLPVSGRGVEAPSLSYSGGSALAEVGTSQDFSAVITNTGNLTASITSITKTGSSRFSFVSGNGSGNVGAGGKRTINLRYSPTSRSTDTGSIRLSLTYDGLSYNYTLPIDGRGYEAPQLTYYSSTVNAQVDSTEAFKVQLENNGSLPLSLTSSTLQGANTSYFSLTGGQTGSIASGQTHDFDLNYSPTVQGSHSAEIRAGFTYDGLNYFNTLAFSGEAYLLPRAQLYIDDVLVAEEPLGTNGSLVEDLTLSIDHPGTSADQSGSYPLKRGSLYVVLCDFGDSRLGHRLQKVQKDLRDAKELHSDTSDEVLTASLDVMGQTWVQETSQSIDLYGWLTKSDLTFRHRFGIVAQEEGYYIDVAQQLSSGRPLYSTGSQPSRLFDISNQLMSALEHGVLEQIQVGRPASSTVKVLNLANEQNTRIYFMDASNVSTLTSGVLTNYNQEVLDKLTNIVNNENGRVILPQDGEIALNEWSGYGYVAQTRLPDNTVKSVTMAIKGDFGDLNGGYGSYVGDLYAPWLIENNVPDTIQPAENYHPRSEEPVDLATGAYLYDHVDFSIGQAEPRGITFARTYNSFNVDKDYGFGPGWNHNWNSFITEYSEADYGFGLRRPADSVVQLVAAQALLELENNGADTAKNWAIKSLIANWATNSLKDNALAVHVHGKVLVFTQLPDGSFVSPPGVTHDLVEVAGGYELRGRYGTVQKFELVGDTYRLKTWTNADSQTLSVTYSGDKPSTVTDAYGRTFTFNYSGGLLTSVSDSTGRSVSYGYSAAGDQISYTDADSNTLTYEYDSNHQITKLYTPDSRLITQNFYNDFGRVYRQMADGTKEWNFYYSDYLMIEQDPTLAEKSFQYDDKKQLLYFTDAEGNRTSSTYDAHRRAVNSFDARGHQTQFQYDDDQNLVRQVEYVTSENHQGYRVLISDFVYDDKHQLLSATDPESNTTTHIYDDNFHRLTTTNALNETVTWTYTGNGEVYTESVVGETGTFTTTYGYDSYGNQDLVTYPDSTTESFVFNTRGHLTSQTNRRGYTTTYTPDNRGNVLNTVYPIAGMSTSAAYDYANKVVTSTNARNFVTKNTYTTLSKKTSTISDFGGGNYTATFQYDDREYLTGTTTPLLHKTTFTLDDAGRTTAVTNHLNHSVDSVLDPNGNVTSSTNSLDQTSSTIYDSLNRPTSSTLPFATQETIRNYYDDNSNLVSFTNAKGKTFGMQYDDLNRVTSLTTPEQFVTQTAYTKRGQVKTVTEPSQQVSSFTYDSLNRLKTHTDSIATVTFDHLDGVGDNTSSISEVVSSDAGTIGVGTHTITRTHDELGRVTSYTDINGNTLNYLYDHNNNVTRITYPDAGDGVVRNVFYAYDSRDLLTTITDWEGRITDYSYDADGRLERIDHANGTSCELSYDGANRLTEMKDLHANGYIISMQSFSYDSADKVNARFVLPRRQNEEALAISAANFSATYDDDNRIASFNGTSISSDADGNLLTAPGAKLEDVSSFYSLSYDSRNRLASFNGVSYKYDFEGNRTAVIGSEITEWVNDPISSSLANPISKTVNGETTYYIWGKGLAYQIDSNGDSSTYHFDQVGSTTAVSAEDGTTITDRFEYSPYGVLTHREGTSDIAFQYNGRYGVQTDENGLLYMRARYYNPTIRRFLNADPIKFEGGNNWHAYANGNPINFNDPSGKIANFLIGAAIGGGLDYAFQVGTNLANNQSLGDALTNIDLSSIAISSATGALTGGIGGALVKQTAKSGLGTASRIGANAVGNALINSAGSTGAQAVRNTLEGQELTHNMAESAAFGALTGFAGSAAGDYLEHSVQRLSAHMSNRAFSSATLQQKLLATSNSVELPAPNNYGAKFGTILGSVISNHPENFFTNKADLPIPKAVIVK